MLQPRRDHDVTRLLNDAAEGSASARSDLVEKVYEELRRLARACLSDQRRDHTLQATALANEAYVRMIRGPRIRAENRRQFFALAATAMRRILVDHARDRGRQKRGGGRDRIQLDIALETPNAQGPHQVDLLALEEALAALGERDRRKARLVELRFFAGLTLEDAAKVLGIARSVAADDWRTARAWLAVRLEDA